MSPHFFSRAPKFLLGAWVVLGFAIFATAQQPQRIERAYDVSDFYMSGRPDDQPEPAPKPLGPDDPIGRPPAASRSQMQQGVIDLFRDNVDPKSWEKDHARATDIVYRDGELIITQTPANHRAIMSMLRQLREDPEGNKLWSRFNETRLTSKRFEGVRLADVIDWVAAETKIKVVVEWPGFQSVGVGPDTAVSLDLTKPLPDRAIRAAFAAAAPGRDLAFDVNARPPTMLIKYDAKARPTDNLGCVYDVHLLPARATGLEPGKSYPRAEVVQALVKRVESATKATGVHESNGLLIAGGKRPVQTEVRKLLDRWDAEAMEEAAPRK
jgi:hypothetical protein